MSFGKRCRISLGRLDAVLEPMDSSIDLFSFPDHKKFKMNKRSKQPKAQESKFFRHHTRGITEEINHHLREVLLSFLDVILDPQKEGCLPLVQLAELVKLEELISKAFLVTTLNSLGQVHE